MAKEGVRKGMKETRAKGKIKVEKRSGLDEVNGR
jgi:hypothetical protein